jgi:hypothetical protein
MKNAINSALLALLVGLLPSYGLCSSSVTLHVLKVGTYGNGNLYLALDQPIDEAGCSLPYIELPANAPGLKGVLAAATLAIATNATVEVKTDSCFNGTPSFSGARAGYFVLNKL